MTIDDFTLDIKVALSKRRNEKLKSLPKVEIKRRLVIAIEEDNWREVALYSFLYYTTVG